MKGVNMVEVESEIDDQLEGGKEKRRKESEQTIYWDDLGVDSGPLAAAFRSIWHWTLTIGSVRGTHRAFSRAGSGRRYVHHGV